MQGIRGYLIHADKTSIDLDLATSLEAVLSPETKLLWLDILGPLNPQVEAELNRVLGWHPLVTENFHNSTSRPKLINFGRFSQITFHAINLGGSRSESRTTEIDIVIAKNYLVTYHKNPVKSIEDTLADLQGGKISAEPGPGPGPDGLLYQIVSHLLDKYIPAIEGNKETITDLEAEALYAPSADLLERIVFLRDEIIELGLALSPQQMILNQLSIGDCKLIRPYVQHYFRDAEIRMRNLVDEQNSYKEILANTLELYRSAMSSRTNDTMKVLTAMSAMFLPLTFLTGLFGMNVHLPLTTHHNAFLWIIILCAGSFIGMLTYFKIKSWF